MKGYEMETPFTFGKYEGKTLEEVFDTDPNYVEKCLTDVPDFSINEKSMQALFTKYPNYDMSVGAIDMNFKKLDEDDDDLDDDDDLTFGDEEGYDAEDLDDFDDFKTKGKEDDEDFDDFDNDKDDWNDDEDDNWGQGEDED